MRIPSSEPERLRRPARRTTVIRAALALGLLSMCVLAFLEARTIDPRRAPLVPSGTTGILVLDLSASVYEDAFGQTIRKLARAGEETGVVAFSDAGYELLPPGTPARELLPLLRFFNPEAASSTATLPVDPWQDFRAGTQISEGLKVAHEALLREHARKGSIVLVSDLEIVPDEVVRLADAVADLRRDGVRLRIVPLFPTPEKYARIKQIIGESSFLRESSPASPVAAPEGRSLRYAAPWTFLLLGAALVLLLAANERLLLRLELRR
ncbi:MAG: vWA domain-containing protein [Gaiellaceae bacterium]